MNYFEQQKRAEQLTDIARRELSGNVTTDTKPMTQKERLRLWWYKRTMKLLEGRK